MNLMIAANDKYCQPAKVMLTSFLTNNKFEHNDVYFLHGNVSESNIGNIRKCIEEKFDVTFYDIKIDDRSLKNVPLSHHFSVETYYRFFAQSLLPKSVNRVMWLDCDMIVKKSLKDFYYQDFENKHIVVCKSINQNPSELIKKLGMKEDSIYFNAGTILFNLDLIRKTIDSKDYFNYIENNREKITWLDQDVLNAIYDQKTKVADYKIYNRQLFSHTKISKEELREIEKNTAIIHYIGGLKPWNFKYQNACIKFYLMYAKQYMSVFNYTLFLCKNLLYKTYTALKR